MFRLLVCTLLVSFSSPWVAHARVPRLIWNELPALPAAAGEARQPGLAGPFVGVHGDALILAGGANFPDKLPWEGGAKIWWDDIWVLEKLSSNQPQWLRNPGLKLPRRLGYGVSVSVPEGVIFAGGHDAERCFAEVFMLSWNADTRELRRTELPSLPQPLTFMAGAMVGRSLYLAGGQTSLQGGVPSSVFWVLDFSRRERPGEFKWEVLPSWPGPARVLPVAAAQRGVRGEEFFLFSGRAAQAGRPTEIFRDAYAYDPDTRRWRTLPSVGGGDGFSVMGATAVPAGTDEVWIFGGDRGDLFLELEGHDLAIEALRARLTTAAVAERLALEREVGAHLQEKRTLYDSHPGFSQEVLAYHPLHQTWRVVAEAPLALPVTTFAVKHGNAILIPSGEIKPGIRTPAILRVRVAD